jgi:hypothetical protein
MAGYLFIVLEMLFVRLTLPRFGGRVCWAKGVAVTGAHQRELVDAPDT